MHDVDSDSFSDNSAPSRPFLLDREEQEQETLVGTTNFASSFLKREKGNPRRVVWLLAHVVLISFYSGLYVYKMSGWQIASHGTQVFLREASQWSLLDFSNSP
jgi:cytochrome c-type biogenesis protein CcmH/NrfG